MIPIILLYAISATTFIIGKQLLAYSTAILLTGLRTIVAGIAYCIYLKITPGPFSLKTVLIPCLQIGFFSFYLGNILKFWALKYLSTGAAAILSTSEPLFAVLFSFWICAEQMTLKKCLGLLFCIGGSLAFTLDNSLKITITSQLFALPAVILILSIACSSFGAIKMRQLIKTTDTSIALVNGISMLTAGVLAITTSFALEYPFEHFSYITAGTFMGLLATMILISNIIAYSLYGYLLKLYSAVLISSASLLRPLFTALYSGNITYKLIYSCCLIIIGIRVLYKEETLANDMRSKGFTTE